MINILHAVTVMNRGGQEALIMNLFRNIDRSEYSFYFLCSSIYKNIKGDYDDEIIKMGGIIYYPPFMSLSEIRFLRRVGELISYYRFFKIHSEFDILHVHTHHAFYTMGILVGAKLAGVSHIIIHSHNTSSSKPWLHKLFRPILNLFKIERFACSRQAALWLFGNKGKTALVVNNGIEAEDYVFSPEKRMHTRNVLNLLQSDFVIGHIGRFNFQKNHTFLIDIFNEIYRLEPTAKLVLVGSGELEESIKEKVDNLSLKNNVLFLGVREDISELLSSFDVFLFPSLFEGLSVVLIEAQASGVQCLISDTNTKDVVITKSVEMLSLKSSPKEWAEKVLSYKGKSHCPDLTQIQVAGYDIRQTVNNICAEYRRIAS